MSVVPREWPSRSIWSKPVCCRELSDQRVELPWDLAEGGAVERVVLEHADAIGRVAVGR